MSESNIASPNPSSPAKTPSLVNSVVDFTNNAATAVENGASVAAEAVQSGATSLANSASNALENLSGPATKEESGSSPMNLGEEPNSSTSSPMNFGEEPSSSPMKFGEDTLGESSSNNLENIPKYTPSSENSLSSFNIPKRKTRRKRRRTKKGKNGKKTKKGKSRRIKRIIKSSTCSIRGSKKLPKCKKRVSILEVDAYI